MKGTSRLGAAALFVLVAAVSATGGTPAVERGTGWTITHLDLDVRIEKDDPSMTVAGN